MKSALANKILLALLLAAQLFELPQAAADGIPQDRVYSYKLNSFTIPGNSLVGSPVGIPQQIGTSVQFSGRYALSGTLHYGKYDKFSAEGPAEIYFIPDRAVARRLPYWEGADYADVISFSNQTEYIRRYIPATIQQAVIHRKPRHYSQRITLLADGLGILILCNASYHSTEILKILHQQPLKQDPKPYDPYGC